jgi:hypothetical protein
VVPVVRLASFGGGGVDFARKPLAPGLSVFVVLDRGSSMAYVNREQLSKWGVDEPTILEAAQANLANHIEEADVEPYDVEATYPTWHVTRDDSYESSRLALPGFLAGFRGRVAGTPLAIVPDRSTLIISGDGREEAVARLARLARQEFLAAPRAISPSVYTVDDAGQVVPLHLPESHPQHRAVEDGHRVLTATLYSDQADELQKRFESEGIDVFVASAGVSEDTRTGELTTWAVMPEGVETLLPEVDLVAFCGGEGETFWQFMVPWKAVFELAPDCLERDAALDPPRWRTVNWPSKDALAKLREASVS